MGSKAGYADTILAALGLTPGQGAERYLWAEADPGVRLLLTAYTDRRLAQSAAEVIRGWAGEEPRALWERLRAEGPCKGVPGADAREVARWVWLWGRSHNGKGPDAGFRPSHSSAGIEVWNAHPPDWFADQLRGFPEVPGRVVDSAGVDPYEVARWLRIVSANRLINIGCDWRNTGNGGTHHGGEFATDIEALLRAVEGVEEMPGAVVEAAGIDPREIARWLTVFAGTHPGGGGYRGLHCNRPNLDGFSPSRETLAALLAEAPEMPGLVVDRADVAPPRLPQGSVVMIDPPYVGTTPYAHDLPRGEVVRIARAWRDAGARVAVCEAEPIRELVDEGWAFIDYADQRVGQKRTFSKQQREVLTMSEPAAAGWRRAEQVGLFGGGA